MQRHDHFSEKFLELSAACPCRRAASCQLCTGKSHGGTLLPLVKNTRNKIRHTHLSPSAESMKIVARLSQKHQKVVVAKMTKPGTEAKRQEVKKKRHCRMAHCRQSPTSCTSKSISTPKKYTYHTQITHYDCFLIFITSDKKRGKATSQLDSIHRRSALQGGAKAQGYALCLSPEAHRVTTNISTIASPTSRDCRGAATATDP